MEAAMAVYGGGGRVTTDVKATAIMDQLNGLETGRWRPPSQSLVTWSVAAFDQRKQLLDNQVRFVYHDIFFVFIHYPSAFSCTFKSQHI